MRKNSINEIYQWNLKSAFLVKLEKMQPKIPKELKTKIFPAFKDSFKTVNDFGEIVSDDFKDALMDPENYPQQIQTFTQNFLDWLESWKINVDWIADEFINLLSSWKENPHHVEKGHLYDTLTVSYFVSYGKEFGFKFRSLKRDEKLANYRKAITEEFNKQINIYLAEMESQHPVLPISKSKELQHIEWLIDYHFNPKKTFEAIAIKMQLKSDKGKFPPETIRKAVILMAERLEFPLKKAT